MGRRARRGHGPYGLGEDEDGTPAPITVAGVAAKARLARLEADARVRAAAIVAHTFPGLDPVAVLAEVDPLKRDLRIAAHNVVVDEENKAQRRAQPR